MSMLGGLANAIGLGGNAAQQAQGAIQGGAYQGQGLMNAQPGAIQGGTPSLLQQQYQQYQAAKIAQQQAIEEFDPNKHEAWTMPMSALVNLWRAKYMDEWVLIRGDKLELFWQHAYSRLNAANKFEQSPGQWQRLREDA